MSSFSLNTGKGRSLRGFENRTSDVFGSLGGLEKDYDATVKQRGPDEFVDEDRESPERDDFKRPTPPRPDSGRARREHGSRQGWARPRWRGRGGRGSSYREGRRGGRQQVTPDWKVNPERWTEYSLEDTDISGESTNKRAAVDFLRDLRKRKAEEQDTEPWDASLHCGKVEYKKPVLKASDEKSDDKKQSFGDVHKMPEFQFGQSKPKTRKLKSSEGSSNSPSRNTNKSDSINLGHLGEEEESSQSENSARQTNQSDDGRLKAAQSDLQDKTIVKIPEVTGIVDCDDGNKDEMPVFQKKAAKGKRNIRGRKKEEDD